MCKNPIMSTWKENIRETTSRATSQRQARRIAEDTGISANRIHTFVSRGYLKTDDVKKLEEWLKNNGYLEDDEGAVASSKDNPGDWAFVIAAQLRATADIMVSDVSREFKAREFASRVRDWNAGLNETIRLFKRGDVPLAAEEPAIYGEKHTARQELHECIQELDTLPPRQRKKELLQVMRMVQEELFKDE